MTPVDPPPDTPAGGGLIAPGGKVDAEALSATGDGEDDGLRRVSFTLQRDLNKRLDKYLTDRITFMSRTQLQHLIEVGGVTVNGRPPKPSTRLRLGDTVCVAVPPPPSTSIEGEDIPIDVMYEDRHLLVINKSPDIIVHPARSHNRGTLLNALVWYFRHHPRGAEGGGLSAVGEEHARPGVVHRLDRKTSGVLVIAKDDASHWKLGRQFEKRTVDKRYLAVVEGAFDADADVIDVPIGPFPSRVKGMRERMAVRHDDLGKPAVTIVRVRERYRGFTLVELELKTGRTHQIRVHLAHRGYPIAGDDMYGGRVWTRGHVVGGTDATPVIDRQALHAAVLGFTHPESGASMRFTAPLREDMASLVRLLRAHREPSGVLDVPGATVDIASAVGG